MMHGLVFPFGLLCILIPVVAVWLVIPAIRRRRSAEEVGRDRERPSLEANIEPAIYRLAKRLGGRVTVSDVVVETGFSASEAENLLQGMVDGTHCRMEVTAQGTVIFEFPELT